MRGKLFDRIMRMKELLKLVGAIAICQAAGVVGSLFTVSAIPAWYAMLEKPVFSPPNWIFGPVWIILYTLMGIALYLVARKGLEKKEVKVAIAIFLAHLAVNASWSIVFFGLRNPLYGLIDISLLLLMIAAVMMLFWKVSRGAVYLLIPYLLWVLFASALNFSIWQLN